MLIAIEFTLKSTRAGSCSCERCSILVRPSPTLSNAGSHKVRRFFDITTRRVGQSIHTGFFTARERLAPVASGEVSPSIRSDVVFLTARRGPSL
jgi:hypothetical protein